MLQTIREVGGDTEVDMRTLDLFFMKNMDCGSQEENVEDVNVVVSPFRPRFGEVQELTREVCTVKAGDQRRQRGLPRSESSIC